ncbi:MAG TPA: TonB-dependent receptor [Candidatus Acidoferrales bacterium]|nr:TonB-dependent receptor [Candidatus Acidoferrales bacterium]
MTTGALLGNVRMANGKPIAGARVTAHAPSARYATTTDAAGSFTMLGLLPDTYVVSIEANGYEPVTETIVVLPAARRALAVVLRPALREIARVSVTPQPFTGGSPSDVFTVQGAAARANGLEASSSGLAGYSQSTVAGAIANVPGIQQDSFANVIIRGGKVQDTAYDFDSVPIPQGLIAEPGGNIVGAQLGTTGVSAETVALGGYSDVGQNALGGVVNEIPLVGTYPAKGTFEAGIGIGALFSEAAFSEQAATADLRWRYAFSASSSNSYFQYGDGHTFYPAEIGTYALGFQTRAQFALSGNVHFAATPHDDVSATFLAGAAAYQQYDSPYQGLEWSSFSSPGVPFPGQPADPKQQVDTPSIARGTYGVEKLQWVHNWSHALGRLQLYQSQIGAIANGPEWDDLSFSDGVISLYSTQYQREDGIGYDYEDQAGKKNEIKAGAQYDVNTSGLYQIVPTLPQIVQASPRLNQYLLYSGDTWTIDTHLTAMATLRYIGQHSLTGDGLAYGDGAIDPHASLAYEIGHGALRLTFDHTSVPPPPLEVQRSCHPASACSDDSGSNANGSTPSYPLAPETADDYAFSYETNGSIPIKLTYFAEFEKNRIDVLPSNFRDSSNAGENPDAVGVPTNAGQLRSHGLELWARTGGLTLVANYNHTLTSSVYQFAFNDLNAAAILAGHLFPANYVPNFTTTASYELDVAQRRLRITPALSYEGGYPYGNGTRVWAIVDGRPVDVPNDNYVNPGYNYYFLKNPGLPWNAVTNPYIATLGTSEGADPNTLRSTPQLLASLHLEGDLLPRVTAILDVSNLFGTATPTQLQGNPYLIGPPGYTGGNPLYEAAYGQNYCKTCLYTLGNGVPTNNGTTAAAPWAYGRNGYVPQAYPMARAVQVRVRWRF